MTRVSVEQKSLIIDTLENNIREYLRGDSVIDSRYIYADLQSAYRKGLLTASTYDRLYKMLEDGNSDFVRDCYDILPGVYKNPNCVVESTR